MRRTALLVAAAITVASCRAGPPAGDAPGDTVSDPPPAGAELSLTDSLELVRAEITAAIGDARAETVSECALLPLGERPCGGPRTHLAYSTAETDSARLAELARIYARLDQLRNEREGRVSTCEMILPPGLALEGGRCVTRPRSGGPPTR